MRESELLNRLPLFKFHESGHILAGVFFYPSVYLSKMGELPIIILLFIIIIWCDLLGTFHDWSDSTKQIYRDLYPFIGKPNQLDPDCEGGAVWWKPPGLELMSCISLFDAAVDMEPLQADVCLKLYAGFQLCPNKEAIERQICQLSAIPGVTYHADQRAFQIAANTAQELFGTAVKMTRVTQGLEPVNKRPSKIRDRLRNYTREHLAS